MSKELLKKISFFASAGFAFVVGLLFILLGDLVLKSGSDWLIGGILITFGSAVCIVLAESYKEKKVVSWVLQGIALALMIAFIGYLIGYHNSIAKSFIAKPKVIAQNDAIFITLLVLSCLTIAINIAEVVFKSIFKEEK